MRKIYITLLLLTFTSTIFNAQEIDIDLFASGFSFPVAIQNAGDDRLFVVEKIGKIKVVNSDGTMNNDPFLDITGTVTGQNEQGLLGLAFHPNYSDNGYFYINYTDLDGNTQVDRYTVSTDPNIADINSRFNILSIEQPGAIHNGGCLNFGLDGYLHIATGDGQGGGDPNRNAQDTTGLLGKILRIDVDNPAGGKNYGIPANNPFEGSSTNAEEIWAYGFRNPWKFSFDSQNGALWIGDVGNNNWEEVNRISASQAGANCGWRCYEGFQEFLLDGCPPANEIKFPKYVYAHISDNCSAITGGYVYRGSDFPSLQGIYIFADFCREFIGGLDSEYNFIDFGRFFENFTTFGEDMNRELYVANADGQLYRITDGTLGQQDNSYIQNIILTPNPASENVRISSRDLTIDSISIFSLLGKRVIQTEGIVSNSHTLSIAELASGLYITVVETNSGEKFVRKLMVK